MDSLKRMLFNRTVSRPSPWRKLIPAGLSLWLSLAGARAWADNPMATLPFPQGEKIIFDIKKLKLTVGEATLVCNGMTQVDGRPALSITFTAQGIQFFDQEEIFLDLDGFFPLMIKRDLDIFGKGEKIVELYDSQKGHVKVVKTVKGETTEQVIKNGRRFDNIYGFIYRYRQLGQINEREEFDLHLPTRDVKFNLVKKKEFSAGGRTFEAYHLRGTPGKINVWFDGGLKKIPLKIDGALGFGNASMVFREYLEGAR
jgi:hypothetical protein